MILKLVLIFRGRGVKGLFVFVFSRLIRKRSHIVFVCEAGSGNAPAQWRPEETVLEVNDADDIQALRRRVTDTPPELEEYFIAIRSGSAIGVFVLVSGRLVHWAFIMKRSRTLCYLGFNCTRTALIGSAFTLPDSRGRGLQTRSIALRINVARRHGYRHVVSETAPDNEFSARALQAGGMQRRGHLRVWVICNRLVVRLRDEAKPRVSIGYCP